MSDASGAVGAHSGRGTPEARVVTGGDADGLPVGLILAADGVGVPLVAGGGTT